MYAKVLTQLQLQMRKSQVNLNQKVLRKVFFHKFRDLKKMIMKEEQTKFRFKTLHNLLKEILGLVGKLVLCGKQMQWKSDYNNLQLFTLN